MSAKYTAVGHSAGTSVGIGLLAQAFSTTGSYNIAFGTQAQALLVGGSNNGVAEVDYARWAARLAVACRYGTQAEREALAKEFDVAFRGESDRLHAQIKQLEDALAARGVTP